MAAFDSPWLTHMSTPRRSGPAGTDPSGLGPASPSYFGGGGAIGGGSSQSANTPGAAPPVFAPFSPTNSTAKHRSTILVHQKSPLLLATPPQITRALAYSHPFLLPLNRAAGLLSWTTDDPWESFLVVVIFWAVTLYGDAIIRVAGPVVVVLGLIFGMYSRRFSPLSSAGWSEPAASRESSSLGDKGEQRGGHGRSASTVSGSSATVGGGGSNANGNSGGGAANSGAASSQNSSRITGPTHQKTLDEMVATLREFTQRCNILLEPFLELTDFLSTQRTPTTASTRPALTALFVRILLCTPAWYALTLWPLHIITSQRVVLVAGTVALTWHARPCRISRTILWRSATLRTLARWLTGLDFETPGRADGGDVRGGGGKAGGAAGGTAAGGLGAGAGVRGGGRAPAESELTRALRRSRARARMGEGSSTGVRFTFVAFENQRRWVGLGWTNSLFSYERGPWTDEHNNAVPPKDEFELPGVDEGLGARWRWVPGSRWRVEGVPDGPDGAEVDYNNAEVGRMGWVYYDNKWNNGRRGLDGWGRWTRRRKWYRDAELIDGESDDDLATTSGNDADTGKPKAGDGASLHPERPTHARQVSAPSIGQSQDGGSGGTAAATDEQALSTSARSTGSRFSLLRRKNARSGSVSGSVSGGASIASNESRAAGQGQGQGQQANRASERVDEPDEAAEALSPALGLQIQGAGKESGWGIGDEALMGLE